VNRVPTSFTIADYCAGMKRNEIKVNQDYQRSDKVWPHVARSYLIETVLKGFPIPKLYLYQVTDIKSRQTYKEIVDGQQRSVAIFDYFNDQFKISKSTDNEDISNRKYSELAPEYQRIFLEYAIDVDLFVSATPVEVVEVFRPMNSYTVPLNAEENRHALWQGKFKWFINDLADKLEPIFLDIGIFKEKQLVRMADNKLLTELCDSFLHGIRTTDKKILDAVYRSLDEIFNEEATFRERIGLAFDVIRTMEPIHQSTLTKPYMIYSLVQAMTHVRRRVPKFEAVFRSPNLKRINLELALPNLTTLMQAVDSEEGDTGKYARFVKASREKTNVKENRKVRFKWFCKSTPWRRV
jgi:hypothetical protein